MDRIFHQIIDRNFSDLRGLVAQASIPVPQELVNEIIQALLEGERKIEYCLLSLHPHNRITARLKTTLWPWPLDLKLRLFRSVDLTHSLRVRASLENNLLLGKLGSFFRVLPEGISLYGNQVVLDIGLFLRTPEQRRLIDLIESAEVETEEGRAILDVRIRVE